MSLRVGFGFALVPPPEFEYEPSHQEVGCKSAVIRGAQCSVVGQRVNRRGIVASHAELEFGSRVPRRGMVAQLEGSLSLVDN